jgi:hypothetical protein
MNRTAVTLAATVCAAFALVVVLVAQSSQRIPSPAGVAATEIRGHYVDTPDEPVYLDGKWIEIASGRPIKRGRDLWGSGADYGKRVKTIAPVWRAGANVSTQLKSELPLVINSKTIQPGTYTMFIDLKSPTSWTLIVSTWPAQTTYNPGNRTALYGAFNYTPDRDVVRAPMTVSTLPFSMDQLTWAFLDMNNDGGQIAVMWDKVLAAVPFRIGK